MDKESGELVTPEIITSRLEKMGIAGEDNKQSDPVEAKEEVQLQSEPEEEAPKEPNSIEEEAQAKGWKEDGEKSAEEFLRAEPLYDELKERGKKLNKQEKEILELKDYNLNL